MKILEKCRWYRSILADYTYIGWFNLTGPAITAINTPLTAPGQDRLQYPLTARELELSGRVRIQTPALYSRDSGIFKNFELFFT